MNVDVEAMCIQFMQDRFSEAVATTVPNPRPDLFYRLWLTSSNGRNSVVDAAIINIESWAADSTEAHRMIMAARTAFWRQYTAMPLVRRVREISGPGFISDPESDTPRYRMTLQLLVRAHRG